MSERCQFLTSDQFRVINKDVKICFCYCTTEIGTVGEMHLPQKGTIDLSAKIEFHTYVDLAIKRFYDIYAIF